MVPIARTGRGSVSGVPPLLFVTRGIGPFALLDDFVGARRHAHGGMLLVGEVDVGDQAQEARPLVPEEGGLCLGGLDSVGVAGDLAVYG